MEYTTNLNLKKPDVNEYYNIEQENENKDLIDTAVGKLNSQVGTETLTTKAQNCTGAINELNKNFDNSIDMYPFDFSPSRATKFLSIITDGKLRDIVAILDIIGSCSPLLSLGSNIIGNAIVSNGNVNFAITKMYIGYNPSTNKRSLVVEWFADGVDYKSYIDIDTEYTK